MYYGWGEFLSLLPVLHGGGVGHAVFPYPLAFVWVAAFDPWGLSRNDGGTALDHFDEAARVAGIPPRVSAATLGIRQFCTSIGSWFTEDTFVHKCFGLFRCTRVGSTHYLRPDARSGRRGPR